MKLAGLAFSQLGAELCGRIAKELSGVEGIFFQGYSVKGYGVEAGLGMIEPDLKSFTQRMFSQCDGLVFIGACGIAVRAVAPWIRSKTTDPAVVVIDEQGRYAISLLSGHLGGANDLAEKLAELIGAEAVVTTATDGRKLFAVDSFAKKLGIAISSMTLAKEISAALLSGEEIGIDSDFPIEGALPSGFVRKSQGQIGICFTLSSKKQPFERTLRLIPRIITLGIGCRKNTTVGQIKTAVDNALLNASLARESICGVASIDLKEREEGLLQFCESAGVSFRVYSAAQLENVEGEFTKSSFVKGVTGVDNVCERAAVLGSEGGSLVIRKQAENGVTVAAAASKWRVCFEN